ncbi:WxcM-like protein [Leeuwenhoekiella aestuarii]|uniref:WxcM-like protein n=1 Tax=Leeuwenhoekiella aestuarii TaxID=2249426 RepID=A0A4Q0NSC1_9FLAO|nr:FdtA/QdtA family cupin domain-containing protein [Leeuwenhoekiella aestuarii]RXG13344.1 WxcM-like protein [Leeuwenhoekiella aestuarii]RXG14925.1 WxcM-like protein [Leeuwenhoekiella aestuarii]
MNRIRRIKLPKIEDRRGNLSVLENDILPFTFKRVYYLYDVPSGASRGGHAHKEQSEFLIALSGSFDVLINTGFETQIYTLNRPDEGLLIPNGYWRELDNFSSGGICLVLASDVFKEPDYIRNLDDFLASKML